MLVINKKLEDDLKKLEQLERCKRLQDNRKKKAKEKNDERRNFIVGKIFLSFFPEFMCLQPQKSNGENEQEFAPLINFLFVLTADEELVSIIKAKAAKITTVRNIHKNS